MRKRIVFYSHNGFGLGHVRRNFLLARALREAVPEADILLLTGSPFPQDPALLEGMDYVRLPAFLRVHSNDWVPKQLNGVDSSELAAMRADIIQSAVRRFRPDLLVADHLPQGVRGEMVPALERLRGQGGRAVAGFRDIVDAPDQVRKAWHENGTVQVVQDYYARVLVYGSPAVFDFGRYGLPKDVASRVTYCGYLGRPSLPADTVKEAGVQLRSGRDRSLLACVGGGADGLGLLKAVVAAGPDLQGALRARMVAVAGPLMNADDWAELRALAELQGIEVRSRIEAFSAHVAACDLLIGMCGYNTACEALSYGVPFLAVPRETPSTEQLVRARAFKRFGLLHYVRQVRLDPPSLVSAACESLAKGPPSQIPFSMEGVAAAMNVLLELL